jgi:hypothetical protein
LRMWYDMKHACRKGTRLEAFCFESIVKAVHAQPLLAVLLLMLYNGQPLNMLAHIMAVAFANYWALFFMSLPPCPFMLQL